MVLILDAAQWLTRLLGNSSSCQKVWRQSHWWGQEERQTWHLPDFQPSAQEIVILFIMTGLMGLSSRVCTLEIASTTSIPDVI